jgi:hypothetical protein
VAQRSRGSPDYGRGALVVVKHPKVDWTNFEKINLWTARRWRIWGWGQHVEVAVRPSTVKEEPKEMLNQDKLPRAMDRTSEEAGWASEEVRNGGGRRRGEKGKEEEEEEVVDFTTSLATRGSREDVFRGERAKRFQEEEAKKKYHVSFLLAALCRI